MSEITLTGGTLAPSPSSPASGGAGQPADSTGAGHNHEHNHAHGTKEACCDHHKDGIEMVPRRHRAHGGLPVEISTATEQELGRILFTLVRFSRFEAVPGVLQKMEEHDRPVASVLQQFDEGGHTLFHWAAKRLDDVRFLQTLVDLSTRLGLGSDILKRPSKDNVGMQPIHWACTEGSIPHAAVLLSHGADMEAKDNSGCTPLLIAAQYGRVEVVAYLLQKGANLKAIDSSRDTALHWAAYKGSNEVCGLLTYYQQLSLATQDAYGQSPLHLAALRGNTSVVRYILQQLDHSSREEREVLFLKDKNGRTPLDLAVHKQKRNVENVLKEALAAAEDPRGHFFRKTLFNSLKDVFSLRSWQFWCGMVPQMDEMDAPSRVPYYIVLVNTVLFFVLMVGVMAPFAKAGAGLLWDKSGLLMINFVFGTLTAYMHRKTARTSPGYMDESHPDIGKWRRLYEETLESLAENGTNQQKPAYKLCHSCHIARPHRSKHCRVTRKCVLLFDHFCPFVDNTVGLNNYHYFYTFVASMVVSLGSFFVTLVTYVSRYHSEHSSYPWLVMALGTQLCLIVVPVGGLFVYHTQLIMKNLTTNEAMNTMRYDYLFPVISGRRVYQNPWDKGFLGNFMDRMNPSRASYEISDDFQSLITKDAPMPTSKCCHNGRCEKV